MSLHKGNQKRIYFEGAIYFVTCHTQNWYRFFKEPIFCEVFIANLRLCKIMHKFSLYAFIVILHHFHLLFFPGDVKGLSKIMHFLKRNISRDINFILGYSSEGAIHESLLRMEEEVNLGVRGKILHKNLNFLPARSDRKLKNKYKVYRRLLEEHWEFLKKLKNQFHEKYGVNHKFPKFRWQKSFRDHYIRNQKDFEAHIKYIHNNPFKHKIKNAENYKYIFTNYKDLINEF